MKKSIAILFSFLAVADTLSAMEDESSKKQSTPHRLTLEEMLSVKRLVTNKEHTDFLKDALDTAIEDVMISSYSISAKKLIEEEIDKAIKRASERGVSIYIYYNKSSKDECTDLSNISRYCVKFEEIDNHSKCLIKDRRIPSKRTVVIGSYNWLSESIKDSSNASMILSGTFVQGLGADIWDGIKFYQSLKYENSKGITKFLGNLGAFTTGEYRFEEGEFYYTLSTPEAHGTLFKEVVEKARKRVLIFSPFIRLEKLQNTLTLSLLEELQKKKVDIKLVTLPSPCTYFPQEQVDIFSFLDNFSNRFPNFSYLKQSNFHAKTLLADNDFICEGSRNCLSSVDDLEHDNNNFELSVAVRGKNAKKLIEEFEKTDIGKSVLSKEHKKAVEPKTEEKKRPLSSAIEHSSTLATPSIMEKNSKKTKPSTWQSTSSNSKWQNNSSYSQGKSSSR